MTRLAIVGAGALGAYVGGYLARSGADLTLIDAWPEHVQRMRESGLSLSGFSAAECFTTPVNAMHVTDVQSLARDGSIDIALVCVKSYDTEWATMLIKNYLSPGGFVVSLQNCLNEERVAAIVGWGRTVGCVASQISVELTGPGEVRRGIPKLGAAHAVFRVGEAHGRSTPRVEEIARLLAPVDATKVTTNLWGERWTKLVANAMRNPVTAASGMSSNDCDREPLTRWLSIRAAGEAVQVGQALGYRLETINRFEPEQWLAAMRGERAVREAIEADFVDSAARRREGMRPSMGQDIIKGRRTEIDYMNGLVVDKGRELGIETPANAGLVAAVKRVERGEVRASLQNVAEI